MNFHNVYEQYWTGREQDLATSNRTDALINSMTEVDRPQQTTLLTRLSAALVVVHSYFGKLAADGAPRVRRAKTEAA